MRRKVFLIQELAQLLYLSAGFSRMAENPEKEAEKEYNLFISRYYELSWKNAIEYSRQLNEALPALLKRYRADFLKTRSTFSRAQHEVGIREIFESCLADAPHQRDEPKTGTETDALKPENV